MRVAVCTHVQQENGGMASYIDYLSRYLAEALHHLSSHAAHGGRLFFEEITRSWGIEAYTDVYVDVYSFQGTSLERRSCVSTEKGRCVSLKEASSLVCMLEIQRATRCSAARNASEECSLREDDCSTSVEWFKLVCNSLEGIKET